MARRCGLESGRHLDLRVTLPLPRASPCGSPTICGGGCPSAPSSPLAPGGHSTSTHSAITVGGATNRPPDRLRRVLKVFA